MGNADVRLPEKGWGSWVLSAAIAVPVLAGVMMLFRAPSVAPGHSDRLPAVPPVEMARLDEGNAGNLIREEATFGDPTPLFLPTRFNATENALPTDLRREPRKAFPNYSPKLLFGDSGLDLHFPTPAPMPDVPADAFLSDKPNRPFLGFGRSDPAVPALATRGASVEVTAASDGRRLLSLALPEARPPGDGNWQPLAFLVGVDEKGVVRPPVLTESSQVGAVDSYFEDFLRTGLHIGARLRPGFYRICIGP